MKPAAVKSLIYKEFYMASKPLLTQMITFVLFAIMGILIEVSFQIGNLALLSDSIKSEIKEMVDFGILIYPVFMAGIFTFTISDTSMKDEDAAWKRFCYSTPVSHMDFAIAKYTAFLMTIIVESILSFAYVAVVCHILNVKFSKIYLAYILAVIAVTTFMAILNHVGILLFHSKDKAGLLMFAVLLSIVLIPVLINRKSGNVPFTKEVMESSAIYLLPWLPGIIAVALILGCLASAMLLKRREK